MPVGWLLLGFFAVVASGFAKYEASNPFETQYPEYDHCDLDGDPSQCPLSTLSFETSTILKTGGATSCIFGDDFGIQIWRRNTTNILIVLGGGNPETTDLGVSFTFSLHPDQTNVTTPEFFGDYGLYTDYISGPSSISQDVPWMRTWGTNVSISYFNGTIPVQHMGAVNVQLVLDWLAMQGPVGDAVIFGVAHGSAALPVWGPIFHERFTSAKMTLISDSTPWFVTSECMGSLAFAPNFVKTQACPLLPSANLVTKCLNGQGFVHADVVTAALGTLNGSDVLYLEIASKADAVNRAGLGFLSAVVLEDLALAAPECEATIVETFIDPIATEEASFIALSSYLEINSGLPGYGTYIINSTSSLYTAANNTEATVGFLVDFTTPFATGNTTTAPVFLGGS